MSNIAISKILINLYEIFSISPVQKEGSFCKACMASLPAGCLLSTHCSRFQWEPTFVRVSLSPPFPCDSRWVCLIGSLAAPH